MRRSVFAQLLAVGVLLGTLSVSLSAGEQLSCTEFPDLDHHRQEQLFSSAGPELTIRKGAINLDYFGICRSLLEL